MNEVIGRCPCCGHRSATSIKISVSVPQDVWIEAQEVTGLKGSALVQHALIALLSQSK